MIKWTKGDAIRLGRAIADFNKAVKALESEIDKLYLPELREYREARSVIKTRGELERIIKSMQRFTKYAEEPELVTLPSGEIMTKWEKRELDIARGVQIRKINSELKKIERADKPYRSDRQKELEAERDKLRNIYKLGGESFDKAKSNVFKKASKDYEINRLTIYKNNYINSLKKYQNFKEYQRLIDTLNNMSPKAFYDRSQSVPQLDDLTYISDQTMAEAEFNSFVEMWLGVTLEEDIQEV